MSGGWINIASFAKSALTTAQKKIDNVLDIREEQQNSSGRGAVHEEDGGITIDQQTSDVAAIQSTAGISRLRDDFFSAFGLQQSASESSVTELPSPSTLPRSSSRSGQGWSSWLRVEAPSRDQNSSVVLEFPPDEKTPTDRKPPKEFDTSFTDSVVDFHMLDDVALSPTDVTPLVSNSSKLALLDMDSVPENVVDNKKSKLTKSFDTTQSTGNLQKSEDLSISSKSRDTLVDENEIEYKTTDEDNACARDIAECVEYLIREVESPIEQQKFDGTPAKVLSGYSSPFDDMETNASSDIEVMSTPNGDYGSESSYKSGVLRVVPSLDCQTPFTSQFSAKLKPLDIKLDRDERESGYDTDLKKKLEQLSKILEMRERRLLDFSNENVKLSIENEQLRRELRDMRQDRQGSTASLERELDSVLKEKRRIEQRVEFLEREMTTRISMQQFQQVVADKDRQISELIKEGEKLTMKELKVNNIVKKLRESEAEHLKTIKQQNEKLQELDSLKKKLKAKEEQELKYDGTVLELKNIVEKQEKMIHKLKEDLEESEQTCSSYKTTMCNLNGELAEFKTIIAENTIEIQNLRDVANESKEAELRGQLERVVQESDTQRQRYLFELDNMKSLLAENNSEFQKREATLKNDLKHLEQKLHEAEVRNQHLLENTTNVTKPLLHQIESLRSSVQSQQVNFERVEKSLFDKLVQAERECAIWREKEQSARLTLDDMRSQNSKYEFDVTTLRNDVTCLNQQINSLQKELQGANSSREKALKELENESIHRLKIVEELQKEKEILVSQFEFEKNQIKSISEQNLASLNAKITEQEEVIKKQQIELNEAKRQQSRKDSSMSSVRNSPVLDCSDDSWTFDLPTGSYSTILEHLRAKLQEREREIWICKEELKNMQRSRDSMAASLSSVNDEKVRLEETVNLNVNIKREYDKLNRNYEALLQMYGEKVEENEELKLDLIDVKTMYKQQIEEFLKKT